MFETFWKHDGWNVGIIDAPAAALLLPDRLPPIAWLNIPAKHSFFADPFLIETGGTVYCFFEELPYRTNRGRISYVRLDQDHGRPHAIYPAIAEQHHLSYPFLLRYEDEILCIPEGSESGRIVAYAARAFPDQWYPKATLLEFPGVDPTIFRYGDYCCGYSVPMAERHGIRSCTRSMPTTFTGLGTRTRSIRSFATSAERARGARRSSAMENSIARLKTVYGATALVSSCRKCWS